MQWTPVNCLDSSLMLSKPCKWLIGEVLTYLPYHELIIVSTGSKHLIVMWTPSQPTDFLLVALKILYEIALSSHVSHLDWLVFASRGDKRVWPCTSAHSMGMSSHTSDQCLFLDVPNLYLAVKSSNTQMAPTLTPRDRCYSVSLTKIDELCHTRCIGIPYEDSLAKSYCESVLLWPIYEVKVEVIAEIRCVKDSERHWSNLSNLVDEELGITWGRSTKKLVSAR